MSRLLMIQIRSESIRQLHVIETYPQLIGYDHEVFKYFQEQ